jgi:DNA-binding CsgD family transcriptional regulator/tetratricopeptide (TPR) repeat protein
VSAPPAEVSTHGRLRERDLELGTIDELCTRVRDRRSRRLLIQGPAGIGKSALLDAAVIRAQARGFLCLTAAAPQFGAQVAFAVAHQALGPLWPGTDPSADPPAGDAAGPAVNLSELNAAAQIILDLAEEQPVLVCVDDVQWADPASLRWLVLLAQRLSGAGVGIVLGIRSGDAALGGDLATLVDDRGAIVVRPAPLSPASAGELISEVLGAVLAPELVAACHRQTGGNPYLLNLLAGSLRQSGVGLTALTESQLAEIGARGVSDGVNRQLANLDPEGRRLAEAVAAVGDIGAITRLAQVAGLDVASAIDAAGRLKAVGLFRDGPVLELSHPLVAAAVRAQLPAATLLSYVRDAADVLLGADQLEAAAALLLELPPQGDRANAETLVAAAGRALVRGAPDVAAGLLERALAEPPADERLVDVWAALGRAQVLGDDPRGVSSLERAVALADRADQVAELALELAQALEKSNRYGDAVAALHAARARLADEAPELAEELEVSACHFAILSAADAADRFAQLEVWRQGRRARSEFAYRLVLKELTHDALLAGGPAQETAALAQRALAGGTLLTRSLTHHACAAVDLAYAGQPAVAREHFRDEITQCRRRGDVIGWAAALVLRGETHRLEGDMVATEVDTRTGIELLPHGERGPRFMLRGLIEALATQGRTEEAAELLRAYELTGELPAVIPTAGLLHARAMVRVQQGALNTALEDLLRAGEIAEAVGMCDPWCVPWRIAAAEILHELGEAAEARRLADRQSELALRFGLEAAIGSALRLQARVAGGERGHALLTEAVVRLERGTARLELARALIELGVAGLARGDLGARLELERGTRLAAELGAAPLADEGERRLLAAGTRPRRISRRGVQSLTAAEQRAARLAAEGLTNREIAGTLVLSEKTIETHLASTFRKLGIRSRLQLADVLEAGVQGQGFSG